LAPTLHVVSIESHQELRGGPAFSTRLQPS
jgi:hypothetical protein